MVGKTELLPWRSTEYRAYADARTLHARYTLGAFFGSLSCIWLGDRLGRIKTVQLGAAVTVIGAILQSTSFSLGQLIVGRLVSIR